MGSCSCTSISPHINMKFLVLSVALSCATAAPSYLGLVGHPNGAVVPVDTPAVAAAPIVAAAAPVVAAAPTGYAGPLNLNVQPLVAHPNGAVTPADEPAVAAARAAHLSTKVA